MNVKGDYFLFIDVPGDGDCFYHSVLKHPHMTNKFNGVQHLRQYLRNSVIDLIASDEILQKLFHNERTDPDQWFSTITCLGEWGKTLDKLILSYLIKIAIITVGNYRNEFWISDTRYDLNTIYKLQEDITLNGIIHIYHHKFGSPLNKSKNFSGCNHFAYLKPIDEPSVPIEINSIKEINNKT